MDFEQLKNQVSEIVAICKDVPEEFRVRCFEMLLTAAIQPHQKHTRKEKEDDKADHEEKPQPDKDSDGEGDKSRTAAKLPGAVKAFLRKKSLSPEDLAKLLFLEDGELHFIKEPNHSNATRGQSEWALLLSLKNAVLNGQFTVDPEDVRSTTQDKGFYDKANFAKNFKAPKYAAYFKGVMEPQGAAQGLSGDGETALAELIRTLVVS